MCLKYITAARDVPFSPIVLWNANLIDWFHAERDDADGDVVPVSRCDDTAQGLGVGVALSQAIQLQPWRQPAHARRDTCIGSCYIRVHKETAQQKRQDLNVIHLISQQIHNMRP